MSKLKTILTICNQSTALEMIKQGIAEKYIFICAKKIKQIQLPEGYKIGNNVISYSHLSLKRGKYFFKIDWTKVLPLDGDLIEKLYACESETMRMVERIPCIRKTYQTRKNYYYNNLRYWAHVLKAQKVDFFYRCAPPHEGYDNVIAHLCNFFNIKTLYFNPFHPGKSYFARFVNDQFPYLEQEYNMNLVSKFNDYISNKENSNVPVLEKWLLDFIGPHLKKLKPTNLPTVLPRKKIRTQRTLLKRNAAILKYYNSKSVIPELRGLKDNYIYVPLHYQYEATTAPMGGPFVDQILMLEILSRLGIKVYVKEHPRISKNRSMEYYVKIASLRNIQMIPISTNNYDLIDNSLCVSSVTGTAGWEGILRGKPALVFGNIFHGYAPGGYFVKSLKDCKIAIDEIKKFKFDKKKLEVFLYTLQDYMFNHNVIDITKALKLNMNLIQNKENDRFNDNLNCSCGGCNDSYNNNYLELVENEDNINNNKI